MRVWAWVAAIGSLIMSFFAIRLIVVTVPQFSDPCFQWGDGNRQSGELSASLPPGGPCRSLRVTSETKTQTVVRVLIVSGGILFTTTLGAIATVRRKPVAMAAAGFIWVAGAIPLVTLAPLALLTGVALLIASSRARLSTSGAVPQRRR